MKKILIVLALCFSFKAYAQTGDPLRDKLDSVFYNIDKSQIPSGYLQEYGAEFTPLHRYNGVLTDSNVINNLDLFRFITCNTVVVRLANGRSV